MEKPTISNDRADVTIWLPLLSILGGVAERTARRDQDKFPTSIDRPSATEVASDDGRAL